MGHPNPRLEQKWATRPPSLQLVSAVTVTVLLGKLHSEAETEVDILSSSLATVPLAVAVEPLPLPTIEGNTAVFVMFQVTEALTFCWPVTSLKVASAIKFTAVSPGTDALELLPFTVIARVSTTGQTSTVCDELVTVPIEALTLVVPGKTPCASNCDRLTAVRSPGVGKVATFSSDEIQTELPVASLVLPSL